MSLNSVNTNVGAMIALQSLNTTNNQLSTVQKHISTGYRVADATDDGAAYAVAQRVRSDVGALTSANAQLGNTKGLISATLTGLNTVSNTMKDMRDKLTALASGSTSADQRPQYMQQYNDLLKMVKTAITDAKYNGKTLIGNIGGTAGFSKVSVVRNENGATYGIATFSGSAFFGSLSFTSTQMGGAATMASMITAGGTFMKMLNNIGTQLNTYGSASKYVDNQISYNSDKIDSLNSGLGSLIDADLAKESAQMQALQIRQQLGTQSLSMANQAPQSLLSLFK
jgi:flagellin